jgi:hypothetical protein
MKRFLSDEDSAETNRNKDTKHEPGKPSEGECLVHQHSSSMVDGKEWATISFSKDHPLYKEDGDGCQIPSVVPASRLRNDPSLHV